MLVFDIPAGVVLPGSLAVIVLRTWNAPDDRTESQPGGGRFKSSLPDHKPADPVNSIFAVPANSKIHRTGFCILVVSTQAESMSSSVAASLRFSPPFRCKEF
jgi:hypothetical protein